MTSEHTKLLLKYAASINDEALSETTDPDFELQYIDIGNVDSNGLIHDIVEYKFKDAPSRARRIVRHGDVIISTVRTYLKAIAPIESPSTNLIVSTGFAVVRPQPDVLDTNFCKYALREPHFIHEVINRSTGVSYPAINASDLGLIPISLPPLATQRAIASYLDRETARIDGLIGAKQRLLGLLAEKRRALITHAVTRGLDPSAATRPSGVPWIGDVPAGWEVEYARRLFNLIDMRSTTGQEELLSVSHLTGVTRRADKDVNMFMAESLEGYKKCQPGDLVINTLWAWMGAMGIAFQEGIVSPDYHVYRPSPKYAPSYIDLFVRTPHFATEVSRYSKGVWSSRLRLYPEEFFEILLPVPPLAEQKQIVDYVQSQVTAIDNLNQEVQKGIALLQERRTALIAAAVTGQIDTAEVV
ncbi:restriction endonuclease subunit S [Chloroflexia bacterium SDU3-3]|nr:restriction endonuclease subunit S [Chloroflexia bacterium SDU3-3]